jgi:hypothetical protein
MCKITLRSNLRVVSIYLSAGVLLSLYRSSPAGCPRDGLYHWPAGGRTLFRGGRVAELLWWLDDPRLWVSWRSYCMWLCWNHLYHMYAYTVETSLLLFVCTVEPSLRTPLKQGHHLFNKDTLYISPITTEIREYYMHISFCVRIIIIPRVWGSTVHCGHSMSCSLVLKHTGM